MIFQEPLTSLSPVYTCGEQVVGYSAPSSSFWSGSLQKAIALFDEVKLPDPRGMMNRLPSQAVSSSG